MVKKFLTLKISVTVVFSFKICYRTLLNHVAFNGTVCAFFLKNDGTMRWIVLWVIALEWGAMTYLVLIRQKYCDEYCVYFIV